MIKVHRLIGKLTMDCSKSKNNIIINDILKAQLSTNGSYTYEAAVDALNMLQSNAEYLKNARAQHQQQGAFSIESMKKFLERTNIDTTKLKSVIHVTGTKGKGSTCSMCELILRSHGFTTGFYSSPHLVNVTERIRIDGKPLSNEKFAKNFWKIYNKLHSTGTFMPIYFQMLTLMAFEVFIDYNVDVAIIEVGIGGEYDTTNVLMKSDVVGITSLGLDHTSLLGDTIESIAWHKGGIMKPECKAFTVKQVKSAMEVLKRRSSEKNCQLEVVENDDYKKEKLQNEAFKLNFPLALKLSQTWLEMKGFQLNEDHLKKVIQTYKWPGRFQIIKDINNMNYYLDGAHTIESIKYCTKWFTDNILESSSPKALIFNSTGDRNSENLMEILQKCNFHRVYFVPNVAFSNVTNKDSVNHNCPHSEQMIKCRINMSKWLDKSDGLESKPTFVLRSVHDAIANLSEVGKHEVLITGSLHLVGSALSVLNVLNESTKGLKNHALNSVI